MEENRLDPRSYRPIPTPTHTDTHTHTTALDTPSNDFLSLFFPLPLVVVPADAFYATWICQANYHRRHLELNNSTGFPTTHSQTLAHKQLTHTRRETLTEASGYVTINRPEANKTTDCGKQHMNATNGI